MDGKVGLWAGAKEGMTNSSPLFLLVYLERVQ